MDGQRFEGSGLVLIACLRDPLDGRHVLLYAASRNEDLSWIHRVFHGPTDWTVGVSEAGDTSVVGEGFLPVTHWEIEER